MARDVICGIYKIENSSNGKVYIGQSVDVLDRNERHFKELERGTHRNIYLQRAYDKDKQFFAFKIIEKCTRAQLNAKEVYYIELHNATNINFGYNLRDGGNSWAHSEETKLKIGLANKGKKSALGRTHTAETKLQMSNSCKAKPPMSEETKKKISVTLTGKPSRKLGVKLSDEHKKKLSDSHMGYIMPEAQKQKIREGNLNKQVSPEGRKNISEGAKKGWVTRKQRVPRIEQQEGSDIF